MLFRPGTDPVRKVGAPSRPRCVAAAAICGLLLASCKPSNEFKPLPPPEVAVQKPLRRPYTEYLEQTGQLAATNSVKLQARIPGYLEKVGYADGEIVRKGASLFTIEPAPYQAQLKQAQANLASAQAKATFSRRDYERYATLAKTDTVSRAQEQQSQSNRDAAEAAVAQAEAAAQQAAITLGYTQVVAPFDGMVTAHQANVGSMVGVSGATDLATIIQVDPIWVNFNISERNVLRLRSVMRSRGMTSADLGSVQIEVGLQDEAGFPHPGRLDYAHPQLDPGTGTMAMRGVLANKERLLLPGYFVRLRIPIETRPDALFVPEQALGNSQSGRTLLVVNSGGKIEERIVRLGGQDGGLRLVEAGIGPDDRVIVGGQQRAAVGQTVVPREVDAASHLGTTP